MSHTPKSWHILAGAVILTILFHKQPPGLNLWIAEFLIFGWMFLNRQIPVRKPLVPLTLAGVFFTLLATVLVHSAFSGWMHAFSLLVLAGLLSAPDLRSLASALGTGLVNIVMAQVTFLRGIRHFRVGKKPVGSYLWKSRIFLIPLIIIIIFISIYRNSSPVFDDLMEQSLGWLGERIADLFEHFNFALLGTFILCLAIAVLMMVRNPIPFISGADQSAPDAVLRKRVRSFRKTLGMGLKNEYRAALFLLVVLNLLILILNITDIHWVWFNFEWEGQYLKQFVHEGTWLLIFSILISITIVLWFFRGNLNFYASNKTLRILSYIWLLQNVILTVSVSIRNFYYISYFSLAYKRIGVIIFLILTLIGLITVLYKVMHKRSGFWLVRTNAVAWFVVLITSSAVPWDVYIARYNFAHAGESFVHLNFLSGLSDKALPYLDVPLEKLQAIDKAQEGKFPFGRERRYMEPVRYREIIDLRKANFIDRYESEGWLSWNLPEHLAYKALKRPQIDLLR
ncbi:MAG TPA: DUF4173 domain-containing protein [Bacteroidales bacterium]|nr:DUF4173 domain-containing protein [Bacteroidales bacterium]HRZ50208.1 DUF4173 domain-containing protein [Bacteroidales bacterium]